MGGGGMKVLLWRWLSVCSIVEAFAASTPLCRLEGLGGDGGCAGGIVAGKERERV